MLLDLIFIIVVISIIENILILDGIDPLSYRLLCLVDVVSPYASYLTHCDIYLKNSDCLHLLAFELNKCFVARLVSFVADSSL